MRSEARTEPPGESMRTTSALVSGRSIARSINLAMLSPAAVPGPAVPSVIVPATVTTATPPSVHRRPIGDIGVQRDRAVGLVGILVGDAAAEFSDPLLEPPAVAQFVDHAQFQRGTRERRTALRHGHGVGDIGSDVELRSGVLHVL